MLREMSTTSTRADALRAAIRAARDIDEVAQAATRVRELPRPLLDKGVPPEAITALATGVNDLVTARLIELTGLDAALREAGASWIVLGSAGARGTDARDRPGQRDRLRRRGRSGSAPACAPAPRRKSQPGARP